ncbi:MAG: hypothetical protein H0V51_03210 [Chloroflexi bacterium]|nr:hypothetical protein [Chloroflexota bacterium]
MARTRICFVGGGSYNWTPKLLADLALTRDLAGAIILHDIDPTALDEMQRLGRRLVAAAGADFTVEASTDLADALRDAEFVIVTITTGGLEAMRKDLEIPLQYGIYQSVGDTVGPGGLSRALRNVPVLVEIARTMERVCPDAWLLNLTNPLTVLTRAVTKTTQIKTIGLCHELLGVRGGMMRMFGAEVEDFEMQVAGINHLIWLLDLKIKGQDGFQMVRQYAAGGDPVPLKSTSGGHRAPFQDRWTLKLALFETYGYLPAAGDRHLAEFFPYFLTAETGAGEDYGVLLTTIEHREDLVREARAEVRAWLDRPEPPPLERSLEESADIIAAIANGRSVRAIVNLPNRGQIDNLPREAVVETLAVVSAAGANPIGVGTLPPGVLNTIYPHLVNQEMIVDAALTGDRRLALQALVGDPLVRDFRAAPRLLDDLLRAHADLLPQF